MSQKNYQLTVYDICRPPINPNQVVEFELWNLACHNYKKQAEAQCQNSSRVYTVIIGQCSQALHDWMEANEE
jgi:hypothetical protein